jgi:hypothetical protein
MSQLMIEPMARPIRKIDIPAAGLTENYHLLGSGTLMKEEKVQVIWRLVYEDDNADLKEFVTFSDYALGLQTPEKSLSVLYLDHILHLPNQLHAEWPEVYETCTKIIAGAPLNSKDEHVLRELAEATGWGIRDLSEDLSKLDVNPSKRASRYEKLVEEYYDEACKELEDGNTRQAGEKMWAAVTALVKLHAALKGVLILHWGHGRIERYITNNIEENFKELFRNLIDKALRLHEHFYEGHFDDRTFKERWNEVVKLFAEARKVVSRTGKVSSSA